MILAGMLAASLASCVVDGKDSGDQTLPQGTEPYYQTTTGSQNTEQIVIPTNDPAQVTYTPADDTVYVATNSAAIKQVADVTKSENVPQFTELHRVGASASWCKVEYNGAQYYVATKTLTTDDIGEKTFTACDKTMYTSGSVNLRKYASSEDFSTILATPTGGTEVKVIAQSPKGWTKVECTVKGKSYTGFMSTQYLSNDPSGAVDDYLKNFTLLDSAVTMYVTTDKANLRAKPYNAGPDDDRGTIIATPTKGTAVTVIARGTVEGKNWCMVQWTENSLNKTYFISADCLSLTLAGTSATLEQMLSLYPELEKFDSAQTLYISDKTVNGRSAPTLMKNEDGTENVVKIHVKKDAVTAVAWGVIKGQDTNGDELEMTWCLIDGGEALGFYFVSFSYLTPNSDGTPATPVISLDALVNAYGFTKTSSAVAMKTNKKASVFATPSETADAVKELASGTAVSVVAQGTTTNGFVSNSWYIIQYEDTYYFASQADFAIA